MTKNERLLIAFQNGTELTESQIRSRFKIANPTAAIAVLRSEGYPIYTNLKDDRAVYRLGTANRRMVATAYAMLGAEGSGMAIAA